MTTTPGGELIRDGSITTSKLAEDSVTANKLATNSVTEDALAPNLTSLGKNKVINGGFQIAQRGTSFVSPTTGDYFMDRWLSIHNSSSAFTITQETSVVPNTGECAMKIDCTTALASPAAGDYCLIAHYIEGYNIVDLVGNDFTVSFDIRSTKTGNLPISLRSGDGSRSYTTDVTIDAADTWESKSFTVSGGLPTAGTWDYTSGLGLIIGFGLQVGTTFHDTPDAWQSSNTFGTSSSTNFMDNTANNIYIANVQVERGATATNFERRHIAHEQALCERYYQKTYFSLDAQRGSVLSGNVLLGTPCTYTTKRATPTLTPSGTSSAGAHGSSGPYNANLSGCLIRLYTDGTGAHNYYRGDLLVDAEF